MQALYCHLSSGYTEGFLEASNRLRYVTHETWTVDWQKLQLDCPHGVSIPISQVQTRQLDILESLLLKRHAQVGMMTAPDVRNVRKLGFWDKLVHLWQSS